MTTTETTTTAEKKSRLENLAKQKADILASIKKEKERIQRKDRQAKTADAAKKRKDENQEKYAYGGLVDIAGLSKMDKGALLGLLLWAGETMLKDEAKFAGFKKRGDAVLAQREAARKKPTVETLV